MARTEPDAGGPQRPRSILWFRWLGAAALSAALASFAAAAIAEVTASGTAAARMLFWTAVGLNLLCLGLLPALLVSAIRARRLARKEWRLVMMRAVWGGPFGTLGALWDLCAEPPPRPSLSAPEALRGPMSPGSEPRDLEVR